MNQVSNGRFITYVEHEELVRELLESIGDFFKQVEAKELSAEDADTVVRAFVRIRM